MRQRSFVLLAACLFFWGTIVSAQEDSCRCEVLICTQCETQTGVTFYTEKCEGSRTKSCQKPTCEPLKNPPKECKSSVQANATPVPEPEEVVISAESSKSPIGKLMLIRGDVKLISKGKLSIATLGQDLYEKDIVETSAGAVAKIVMVDKNVLNLAENSRLKLKAYSGSVEKNNTNTTLDLIWGKVRSQVVTKNKVPDRPHFKVRTPAAVAGVRGTDFITTHLKGGDVSKVETLEGTVELVGHGREERSLISRGQFGSYVVVADHKSNEDFKDDDIAIKFGKGFLSPINLMSSYDYDRLKIETDYRMDGSDRVIAANSGNDDVCSKPSGKFNQCAWMCRGNPDGASRCRTDLPGVSCVRKRCDANGRWSDELRLPASHGTQCSGQEVSVGPCDY